MAGAVIGALAAIPLAAHFAPERYLARTAVVWEQLDSTETEARLPRQLRTMVESIELPQNLSEIRRRLRLEDALPDIADRLTVEHDGESNLVRIVAADSVPRRAASLANTAAAVFVERRRAFESERRRELVAAIDEDLARTHQELARARAAYDAFRRASGVADLSAETQRAIELSANLKAQADLAQTEAAVEAVRNHAVRGGPTGAERSLARRISEAQLELIEARSRFAPAHPTVQNLVAQLAALRQQLSAARTGRGRAAIAGAIEPQSAGGSGEHRMAVERQRTYEKLAGDAAQRLQRLSEHEGEATRLLAAQRVAEQHLGDLTAMRDRAVDEARAPATGLRVVSRAIAPERAEVSLTRPMLFAAVPLLFALATALGVALQQVRGLKIHTAREVAYWGQGVTVGATTWPRDPEALPALVEELADGAAAASGHTLVVAAEPEDAALARALAAGMAVATVPQRPEAITAEVVAVPAPRPRQHTMPLGAPSPELAGGVAWRGTVPFGLPVPRAHGTTALVRRDLPEELDFGRGGPRFSAWRGALCGPALRRMARFADRVLVLTRAGSTSIRDLARLRLGLGRDAGVGFLVIDVEERLAALPDRAGAVDEFWRGSRG